MHWKKENVYSTHDMWLWGCNMVHQSIASIMQCSMSSWLIRSRVVIIKNVELLPFQKCPVIDPLTKTLRSRSLFIDHLLDSNTIRTHKLHPSLIYISGQLIQDRFFFFKKDSKSTCKLFQCLEITQILEKMTDLKCFLKIMFFWKSRIPEIY